MIFFPLSSRFQFKLFTSFSLSFLSELYLFNQANNSNFTGLNLFSLWHFFFSLTRGDEGVPLSLALFERDTPTIWEFNYSSRNDVTLAIHVLEKKYKSRAGSTFCSLIFVYERRRTWLIFIENVDNSHLGELGKREREKDETRLNKWSENEPLELCRKLANALSWWWGKFWRKKLEYAGALKHF